MTPVFPKSCERWGVYEAAMSGKTEGNPFKNTITGIFTGEKEEKTVHGFYDGDGIYRVRFMPSYEGCYRFRICGDFSEETFEGAFEVTAPSENNHGPVHVANKFHFNYADGTPHFNLGTTCYVWNLQSMEMQAETLESFKKGPFNKVRFCVLPKHYDYNLVDPITFPFEGTPCDCSGITHENFREYGCSFPGFSRGIPADNNWDLSRFNVEHFRLLESNVEKLRDMNVEADLILFHPYDRWGFASMTHEQDLYYLRYVIARLAAFRNIWWSMANEYDLLLSKTVADWDDLGEFVHNEDPYGHLCSIHNCKKIFDYTKDWITHCSIQRENLYMSSENTDEWRKKYGKPVMLDEIAYEGNIQHGWGNLPAEELMRRFWEGAVRGGYPGHGETILDHVPTDSQEDREIKLWWSHGGKLKGRSPERIAFLRQIMEEIPNNWRLKKLEGVAALWDAVIGVPDDPEQEKLRNKGYFIHYYSFMAPMFRVFHIDDVTEYEVDVLDTWNMTVTHKGRHKGEFTVDLPGKPYMAIRLVKCED